MNGPARPETSSVLAVELERLRGTAEAGFARVDGAFALLVQRSDQSDRQLTDHEIRLGELERRRWPLAGIGALTALGTAVLALWSLGPR